MPDFHEVLARAAQNCGFVTMADVAVIKESDRLRQLLVRCGNGRFTCAAQDVEHFAACVAAGGDYVRDVSFPTTDAIWQPRAGKIETALRALVNAPVIVTSEHHPLVIGARDSLRPPAFHEEDCGGVWDGSGVISDADPGL